MKSIQKRYEILDVFVKKISEHIEKIHVFYTLFSKKQIESVRVYGRLAERKQIKLAAPFRTYEQLISQHLIQCFPAICAWKLTQYLSSGTAAFHLDSFEGHIFEAQEILEKSGFNISVYPGGDCSNPVISTADLLLDLLDKRLEDQGKSLLFDNIRPVLSEFGDNVLVYPILSKHLPFITPVDKVPIDTMTLIKHPVFWVFKGSEMIDSNIIKRSKSYRNLLDYASSCCGVVKMFGKKDIEHFRDGDYGVYLNTMGKEIINSYIKAGKRFKPYKFDLMVESETTREWVH